MAEWRELVCVEWAAGDRITLRYSSGDVSGIVGTPGVAVSLADGAGLHRVDVDGVMRWEKRAEEGT